MSDKAIYKMNFDCGRMGDLQGIFVAEKTAMQSLIDSGKEVYFGEVLGKHSDISGPIDAGDIKMITDDPAVIAIFEEHDFSSGYNPFEYDLEGSDEEE